MCGWRGAHRTHQPWLLTECLRDGLEDWCVVIHIGDEDPQGSCKCPESVGCVPTECWSPTQQPCSTLPCFPRASRPPSRLRSLWQVLKELGAASPHCQTT